MNFNTFPEPFNDNVKSKVNVGDIFKPVGFKMFPRKLLKLNRISKTLPTAWELN